jgi:primosomal protein N' (replication factor Y)
MTQYVEIAVNVPQVSGLYHYHLPADLEDKVSPGSLVVVPFGKQSVQGVVLRLMETAQVAETRPVQEIVDALPALTPTQIEFARWMSDNTLAPLAICLDAMLPSGLSQEVDLYVQLTSSSRSSETKGLPPLAGAVLSRLQQRGDQYGRQLDAAFPRLNWRAAVKTLKRQGLVQAYGRLPAVTARPKLVRTVQLAVSPETIQAHMAKLSPNPEAAARRRAILNFLQDEPWAVDASWVYAQSGGKPADLEKLAEMGWVVLGEAEVWRDPLDKLVVNPYEAPILTADQQHVFTEISAGIHAAAQGTAQLPFLLHGVTGSGKTEIYLQAVAEVIRLGRQSIVMVPEISLTPQTLRRFIGRFPGQVGVVHSRLSAGERYDTWRRARAGKLPIVVGPRSALFTPMPSLGLIIVDECHDESYFQGDLQPCYHAVSAAVAYARLAGAVVVCGSATPDVSQAYQAVVEKWHRLTLPYRLLAHRQVVEQQAAQLGIPPPALNSDGQVATLALPSVRIVDMRQELKTGNRSIFSHILRAELEQVLANHQQAILFLNRRGTATYVFCRDCGKALHCPRCDRSLTYHNPPGVLTCHACGYQRKMPEKCPQCGSRQIRQFGTGTERVESEVQALFPMAHTLRWDYDTTRQKGAHDLILSHFAAHRADILIGTQMLAKGLDLPLVTLVGVVLAEVGLNLPDYRASERTFQVLTQVAGRAGRSLLGGKVILQTYQPEHYAIQAAAGHDYNTFYCQELGYRRQLGYPPFSRFVRLEYRHKSAEAAQAAAEEKAGQLRQWIENEDRRATELIGPTPCFYTRLNSLYRWQIILRGPDPLTLLRSRPLGEWHIEVDPPSLL